MTADSWWNDLTKHPHTPIAELIDGFAAITDRPIPYSRLPTRARTNYAPQSVHWSDLAEQTLTSLINRPKGGVRTVRAILDAARQAGAQAQSPAARNLNPATAAADLIAHLPEPDRSILASRRWSRPPLSQQETAAQLATNATWVHRHQDRAESRFAELRAEPHYSIVNGQADLLRRLLGPVTNEHHIAAAISTLGVKADDVTAAMLVHLAGPYINHGQWVIHEPGDGMAAAIAAIKRTFTRQPAPSMADLQQALAAIGIQPDVTAELVEHQPGLRRFGDQWVRWGTSKADKAEAVLHLRSDRTPATLEKIAAAIGEDYSERLLRQTLHDDPRFTRASQHTWALKNWGMREYRGIFSEIATRIDAAGGAITTTDLMSDITTDFPDIAELSITTYTKSLAFKIECGVVRRRTAADPWPAIPPLNRARGAFRNGQNQIRLAIPVGDELLRGSGQPLPRAVAQALSVGPGRERLFTGPMNAIVRWPISSPRGPMMTALRQLAAAIGAGSEDTIVLAFNLKDSTLQAARLPARETLHRQLATLLGRTAPDPVAALARSLDCTPSEVIDVLRHRGDDDLAGVLAEHCVTRPGTARRPPRPPVSDECARR